MFSDHRKFGLLLSLVLCHASLAAQPQRPPTLVETAPVRVGKASVEAHAVGSLEADEAVVIRSEVAGRIVGLHFEEGKAVRKGERLVSLDQDEHRARLAQSIAEARLARLNYERLQDLLARKLASQKEYDEALAELQEAQAREELDRVLLAKVTLNAPFSGVLGLRRISEGAYVKAGEDIVTLVRSDPVKVEFRLPERYRAWVDVGQPIQLRVDAMPASSYPGTVYAIDPSLDAATRTLLLKARIANPDDRLKPGMFARVAAVLERRDAALWIPEQALVPRGTSQYVFRISDATAHLVEVEIGQRVGGEVEVRSGLSPGDEVVSAGQIKIADGMPVNPVRVSQDGQGAATP